MMVILFLVYMIVWPVLFILAVDCIYKELQNCKRHSWLCRRDRVNSACRANLAHVHGMVHVQ